MNLSTAEARARRADLAALARPQGGVNALASDSVRAAGAVSGVTDNGDVSALPVPVTTLQPAPSR